MNDTLATPTLAEAIAMALSHARQLLAQRKYAEAEPLLWDVIRADSRNHAAMHLLGLLALQFERLDVADKLIGEALALDAVNAAYHASLGRVRKAQARLDDAARCFRRALELDPHNGDACVLLGLALKGQGRLDEAIAEFQRALALKPQSVEAKLNLANAIRERGDADAAAPLYREAAADAPDLPAAQGAYAASLFTLGHTGEALAQYRRALELKPDQPGLQFVRGWLAHQDGSVHEALQAYRRAVTEKPDYADAWVNLGLSLADVGEANEAMQAFRTAIELQPEHVEAHINFASGLADFGMPDQALAVLRRANEFAPDETKVLVNLGAALIQNGLLDEATHHLRRANALQPDQGTTLINLGAALRGPYVQRESIECLQRGVELAPANVYGWSSLLLSLNYSAHVSQHEITEASRAFGRAEIANPALHAPVSGLADRAGRRLRVGYVSPDFRAHSVAYFFEPLLDRHDRSRVEVFCYSLTARPDHVTARLRAQAEHWAEVFGMPDAALAARIREDGIDVLVDLTGHTAYHRLSAFARRAAPVQIAWLGYPSTTGLPAMDFRMSDPVVDPAGWEVHSTESLLRLPASYFCFRPDTALAVASPPSSRNGCITFGSFNSMSKVSLETVALWARVLNAVPGSRFVTKNLAMSEAATRERLLRAFAEHGVAAERVELVNWKSDRDAHLAVYHEVDIALDTSPYNGATTTCEALWMGVPVLTVAGVTHAGRMGASILCAAGLEELVAPDEADFLSRAVALAGDATRLAQLRASMRERLAASSLMDETGFARAMEGLFEQAAQQRADALVADTVTY